MASISDVKYKEPYATHLTLRLARFDAVELLDAYEQAWRRNNYTFRIDGKLPDLYNDIYKIVFNGPSKVGQKPIQPSSYNDVVTSLLKSPRL